MIMARRGAHLGDDEEGEVEAVHEEVGDSVAHVLLGALDILLDQDAVQAGRHHRTHQLAIVPPHRLDALRPSVCASQMQPDPDLLQLGLFGW